MNEKEILKELDERKMHPPEAATPEGADINNLTQVHYSTESEKEQ